MARAAGRLDLTSTPWRRRGENFKLSPAGRAAQWRRAPSGHSRPAGPSPCPDGATGTSNIEANKSDLRNHHAIRVVQPRLYDCVMVTQITLNLNG